MPVLGDLHIISNDRKELPMTLKLESPAFQNGAPIPERYTKEGENISPPLRWTDPPAETKEFALIFEDLNAGKEEPFVHWLLYKIQHHVRQIEEGVLADNSGESAATVEGKNSFGEVAYGGPRPPSDDPAHHYVFRLYALDDELNVSVGLKRQDLLKVMKGHILGVAEFSGTYQSQSKQRTVTYEKENQQEKSP
jgi:Raf kinase inhibitor-like YbhB/YbcL family protein